MQVLEARKTILLKPPRGANLLDTLTAALAEHHVVHAWIQGRGTFDDVELRDAPNQPTRTFATTSRIVSLDGTAHASPIPGKLTLAATVARPSIRGPELLSGEIVRGIAGDLELLITVLEQPSLHSTTSEEAAEEPEAEAPSPWAQVAAASVSTQAASVVALPGAKRAPPPPPPALAPPAAPIPPRRKVDIDELCPEVGDLIDHFAFGRATVVRSDGDEISAQDLDSGRTRTLRIQALSVSGPFEEDGKRVYRLTQKRGGA